MISYSGKNDSANQIMEKAKELMIIMDSNDNPFWANWMIDKTPSSVEHTLAQQAIPIYMMAEAS